MKKKIVFTLVTLCVLFTAVVVPSFAWSYEIDGNGNLQTDNQIFEGDFDTGSGESDGDGYYQYIPFVNGTIAPDNGRQWKDTLIRLEIFSNGNTAGTVYVTPTGSTNREWTYEATARYYYLDGDFLETSMESFRIQLELNSGQIFFNLAVTNDRLAPYLSYRLSLSMDYEYLLRDVLPDINEENSALISSLNQQINRLTNEIVSKDELIEGLKNNNVFDGLFSGIVRGLTQGINLILGLEFGGSPISEFIAVVMLFVAIWFIVWLVRKLVGLGE